MFSFNISKGENIVPETRLALPTGSHGPGVAAASLNLGMNLGCACALHSRLPLLAQVTT